jgi:hypothetical protein
MRSSLVVLLGAAVVAMPMVARAAPEAPDHAKPIAGTSCSEFPADNWWHADVSGLPVHDRSRQWLSHMSTGVDLHPASGRRTVTARTTASRSPS